MTAAALPVPEVPTAPAVPAEEVARALAAASTAPPAPVARGKPAPVPAAPAPAGRSMNPEAIRARNRRAKAKAKAKGQPVQPAPAAPAPNVRVMTPAAMKAPAPGAPLTGTVHNPPAPVVLSPELEAAAVANVKGAITGLGAIAAMFFGEHCHVPEKDAAGTAALVVKGWPQLALTLDSDAYKGLAAMAVVGLVAERVKVTRELKGKRRPEPLPQRPAAPAPAAPAPAAPAPAEASTGGCASFR